MKQVPLFGKDGVGKFALVDDEDFENVNKYKWFVGNHGRPWTVIKRISRSKQINAQMHRYILNPPVKVQVDHKNCNPFDNQRHNLRLATHQQNQFNRPPRNKSGRKGVTWSKAASKWLVQIQKDYVYEYLGIYTDLDEAARVYEERAKELFGEFAYDSSGDS